MKTIRAAVIIVVVLSWASAHAATNSVTNVDDSGAGSLRAAIINANNAPGIDDIEFNIPGTGPHTIKPTSALPIITGTVRINGYTQSGATSNTASMGNNAVLKIELDGSMAGNLTTGLVLRAAGTVVRGLAINGFGGCGIVVDFDTFICRIVGNFIGPDVDGVTLIGNGFRNPNSNQGIELDGYNNTLTDNIIAGNEEDGIFVWNTSTSNFIQRNSIYANGTGVKPLGIDLFNLSFNGGVSENDPCDGDAGGNQLQNFPELTSATSDGTNTTITGTLDSTPNAAFTIELFANTECDGSGFGEGQTYLGSTNVMTDAECQTAFAVTFPVALANGTPITATATGIEGTSEFSECLPVIGPQPHDFAVIMLKAPKNINLNAAGPALTKRVKVQIQNRSPHDETITNLAALVSVTLSNLKTGCTAPVAELINGPPNQPGRVLKPKQKMNVFFDVTFDPAGCVPDPLKSTSTEDHTDFAYMAEIHHEALDGNADTHPECDTCPRGALPAGVDPNPDPNKPLKDKGCGNKDKTTRLLGAPVVTDVFIKQ